MRTRITLFCCTLILTGSLHAQSLLINGDFEDEEGSSDEGWEWICGPLYFITNPAPIGGSWAVSIRVSNNAPCIMTRMYQRLPNAVDGDVLELSGWVRNQHGAPVTGAFLGLGTLSDGVLTPMVEAGTLDYPWEYQSLVWTVALNEGDTAVVILSPGELPPTGIYSLAAFDGLALNRAVGLVEEHNPTLAVHRWGDQIIAAMTNGLPIREAHLLDAQGRYVRSAQHSRSTVELSTLGLAGGLYILVALTESGQVSKKFLLE